MVHLTSVAKKNQCQILLWYWLLWSWMVSRSKTSQATHLYQHPLLPSHSSSCSTGTHDDDRVEILSVPSTATIRRPPCLCTWECWCTQRLTKEIWLTLFHMSLSVSYDRVLSISTDLGDSFCRFFQPEGAVCLPELKSGLFTTGEVDNIDHNSSLTSAQDSFHARHWNLTVPAP